LELKMVIVYRLQQFIGLHINASDCAVGKIKDYQRDPYWQ